MKKTTKAAKVSPKSRPLPESQKRGYLSQSDVPSYSLTKALAIATAIADNYGKAPTKPLRVAEALQILPTTSGFRMLTGASIAYGLTDGGYNSDTISLTPLGKRIVAPTEEGDDIKAKREASLKPRVIREFLTKYNGSKLPTTQIAINVLEELGVPKEKAKATAEMITEIAMEMGFLRDVKGSYFVDIETTGPEAVAIEDEPPTNPSSEGPTASIQSLPAPQSTSQIKPLSNRVFITHGKNKEIVTQIKELLTFGSFQPVISVEHETVSKPVPDKVMDDMRSCSAAIIHVGNEQKLLDEHGQEQKILNPNVLIEIGAAMALYTRRFILLVEKGVTLPSNLQGLYEVRYEGTKLDYEATMKLLKAFNDFKS